MTENDSHLAGFRFNFDLIRVSYVAGSRLEEITIPHLAG